MAQKEVQRGKRVAHEISSEHAGLSHSGALRPDGMACCCTRRRQAMPSFQRIVHHTLVLLLFLCISLPSLAAEQPADSQTTPPAAPRRYYIEISIERELLTLFERGEMDELVKLKEYPVGTAVRGLKTYPLGKGMVTAIQFKPWWYPTPYSRQVFRERGIQLPTAVPPGHPLNYMGPFKISLSHKTHKGAIYRIHGNNNPQRVGRRVTGGCFVMENEGGLELARTITVGTEVNILP
jgi:lipoprotein-anchoring transpeptidase ErfK/SrfK